ncbi:uncharacterized protein BDZ99DRAFT_8945 [Mytilinidion resinicola]|uniref:Uncharacterized protein n=1 Tax=Mytilinidion resinicola TaxID=574789 RepID=A0A6A6Z9Y4_9PEZI|nr:uncharacterized protein BDZ99DRAFT_8945 [Mytilinidion resinicola]KAF2817094.1 hypothetical protein BDZ99DRAFT_8945 [Mytilinidion resinicola]
MKQATSPKTVRTLRQPLADAASMYLVRLFLCSCTNLLLVAARKATCPRSATSRATRTT